jgi:1-deoxy-D-xylulose-5-phosphate synthase
VRYPRGAGIGVNLTEPPHELATGEAEVLRRGGDVVIAAYGTVAIAALAAADELAESGIDATVVNARFAKPLDADLFLGLAARIPRFATVEEHVVAGGFGSALAELFHERTASVELTMLGIPDEFVDHGAQRLWRAHYGLDAAGIARAIRSRWPQLVKERAKQSAG